MQEKSALVWVGGVNFKILGEEHESAVEGFAEKVI